MFYYYFFCHSAFLKRVCLYFIFTFDKILRLAVLNSAFIVCSDSVIPEYGAERVSLH